MPETIALNAEVRTEVGTKYATKLRQAGKLPAIIYGHGQKPVAVSLDLRNFVEMLHHGHRLLDVKIGKTSETLLVKDLQYDHLGKDIIHADLIRVDLTEMVKVAVPIELKGTAKGTHEGGIVDEHLDHLEVECRASDIPDFIPVSVKELGVGDAIHAGDIELGEGMKLATDPETLVLMCHLVAAAKSTEELEEEMPVAPEVITEKAAEEGAEEKSE
jgi:large subunit ribosomal protein L25